jgi:hypothetical protein
MKWFIVAPSLCLMVQACCNWWAKASDLEGLKEYFDTMKATWTRELLT